MKTKVLILQVSSEIGGAETDLIDFLQQIPRDLLEITIVCPKEGPLVDILRALPVNVVLVDLLPWRKPKFVIERIFTIRRLIDLAGELDIDIVHANDFWSFPYACKIKDVWKHIRIMTHIRGEVDQRKIRNYHLNKADFLIPVSNAIKDALLNAGISEAKIRTHYGYGNYEIKIEAVDPSNNVQSGKFIAGMIARLVDVKGIEYFLQAVPGIVEEVKNVEFQILGSGEKEYEKKLRGLVDHLNILQYVNFLGFQKDIYPFLKKMDLLVSTSLSEGLGLSVLSAMAVGKPVIATDVGGSRELVLNGVNGFTIPPKNPEALSARVVHLFNDPDLKTRMGRAGRLRYEEIYLNRKFAQNLLEIYHLLVDGASSAGSL